MDKNFKKGTPEQFMSELQAKISELGGSVESCDSVMSADEPTGDSDERYVHSLIRLVEDALENEVDSIQWDSTKDGAVNFVVCYMGHVMDYAVPLSDLKMDFDSMDEDADYIANAVLHDLDNLGDEEDITSSEKITGSTYSWSDFEEFNRALDTYMPSSGEGDTMASQVCTAVAKLIYKWFNDGDVFDNTHGLEGWANDLSSYANWLYKYVPQSKMILERVYRCYTEDDYTSLLWDLAEATLDLEDVSALEDKPKQGSVYDCEGPFEFRDYDDDDDEYDDEYDDDYYGHY